MNEGVVLFVRKRWICVPVEMGNFSRHKMVKEEKYERIMTKENMGKRYLDQPKAVPSFIVDLSTKNIPVFLMGVKTLHYYWVKSYIVT